MRRGCRLVASALSEASSSLLASSSAQNGLAIGGSVSRAPVQVSSFWLQHSISGALGGMHLPRYYSALPTHTVLKMPALSPTMTVGNIASWHKKEGDKIKVGDVLADIETDKATLAFEMVEEGFLARILLPAGSKDIKINQPVAILVEEQGDIAAFKDYQPEAAPASTAPAPAAGGPKAAAPAAPAPTAAAAPLSDPSKLKIGPGARFLLEQNHVPLGMLVPSGPRNFVTREDVLDAIARFKKGGAPAAPPAAAPAPSAPKAAAAPTPAPAAPAPQPAAPAKPLPAGPASLPAPGAGEFVDVPNNQIRRVIAKRLLESKTTIPHQMFSVDVRLEALGDLRAALKEAGRPVSVNDLVIRAAALALRDVPQANARWDEASGAVVASPAVDVSIAVATPTGLITPIVKGADQKSVFQISAEVKDLAKRARENKLKPEEFMGGSFSVSNLGMFGMDAFSAIINPPQAAILAVGGPLQRVVMQKGKPAAETYMTVTVSGDARVVDGETAGKFMQALKRYLEVPGLQFSS